MWKKIILLFGLFMIVSLSLNSALPPFPFIIETLEKTYTEKDGEGTEDIEESGEVSSEVSSEEIQTKEFTPTDVDTDIAQDPTMFPVPQGLEDQVDFWVSVYTKYNDWEVILHDADFTNLVYEVIEVKHIMDRNINYRSKLRKVNTIMNSRKKYYRNLLISINNKEKTGNISSLTEEEKRIYEKFSRIDENRKFLRAAQHRRMRMQFGQRNNFIEGLKASGKYIRYIEDIFKEMNMPLELTKLIYVESMFNLKAYSKVGASGIWQFMRSTGKRFLEINYAVDERRDPLVATRAAAKLLNQNYRLLKEWPIAVTAYNHGASGMLRAVRRLGSRNLKEIIDNYRSRTFGFASKNFYGQFLAALEVESNVNNYFGEILKEEELQFKEFIMPDFVAFSAIQDMTGLNRDTISDFNPALKEEVFSSYARIPKGYSLRLPEDKFALLMSKYDEISKELKYDAQKRKKYYRVQRGDSLWTIARRHRTSVHRIKELNGLQNGSFIRAGKLLMMP